MSRISLVVIYVRSCDRYRQGRNSKIFPLNKSEEASHNAAGSDVVGWISVMYFVLIFECATNSCQKKGIFKSYRLINPSQYWICSHQSRGMAQLWLLWPRDSTAWAPRKISYPMICFKNCELSRICTGLSRRSYQGLSGLLYVNTS